MKDASISISELRSYLLPLDGWGLRLQQPLDHHGALDALPLQQLRRHVIEEAIVVIKQPVLLGLDLTGSELRCEVGVIGAVSREDRKHPACVRQLAIHLQPEVNVPVVLNFTECCQQFLLCRRSRAGLHAYLAVEGAEHLLIFNLD